MIHTKVQSNLFFFLHKSGERQKAAEVGSEILCKLETQKAEIT